MKREPIISFSTFERVHLGQRAKFRAYALSGRGRHKVDEAVWNGLKETTAGSLKAINTRSRIEFARAAEVAFTKHFSANEDIFFVTLAPRRFAVPLSAAPKFATAKLIAWTKAVLSPHAFVGVVEAAYYSNHRLPGSQEPTVSWHTHALVWGAPESRLRSRIKEVNQVFHPLVDGRIAAHARKLPSSKAIGHLFYMLKAPLSEYRIYPFKAEHIDPETGEITLEATSTFQQKKRILRPGDHLKMCKVMGERALPELTFASDFAATALIQTCQMSEASIKKQIRQNRQLIASRLRHSTRRAPETTSWLRLPSVMLASS